MEEIIKISAEHPVIAIIMLIITALTSKYAWAYFAKKSVNVANVKIAELDVKNQLNNVFLILNQCKKDIEIMDDLIDQLQHKSNAALSKIEVLEDEQRDLKSDCEKRETDSTIVINKILIDVKDIEARFKRFEKKIKKDQDQD
jgi:hypothetical protein